jgi:hypothetical protein
VPAPRRGPPPKSAGRDPPARHSPGPRPRSLTNARHVQDSYASLVNVGSATIAALGVVGRSDDDRRLAGLEPKTVTRQSDLARGQPFRRAGPGDVNPAWPRRDGRIWLHQGRGGLRGRWRLGAGTVRRKRASRWSNSGIAIAGLPARSWRDCAATARITLSGSADSYSANSASTMSAY